MYLFFTYIFFTSSVPVPVGPEKYSVPRQNDGYHPNILHRWPCLWPPVKLSCRGLAFSSAL
jgi:hypothetical protein